MNPPRGVVIEANILIRAVLGKRVLALLQNYEDSIAFYAPDVCFDDAREWLPGLLANRGDDPKIGIAALDRMGCSSSPWMRPSMGISGSSPASESRRATSKTGPLSRLGHHR